MQTLKTDWDSYYRKPAPSASVTRKITALKLLNALKKYPGNLKEARIWEMGGANSCFFSTIYEEFSPKEYQILDTNKYGLELFRQRTRHLKGVSALESDVLKLNHFGSAADIVFSVGLIEHFDQLGTAAAIGTHFEAVRSGGLVVITFPTPTFLYRWTRSCIEKLGKWGFPDERPLPPDEVMKTVEKYGRIIHQEINWPIFLTQGIIVAIKT